MVEQARKKWVKRKKRSDGQWIEDKPLKKPKGRWQRFKARPKKVRLAYYQRQFEKCADMARLLQKAERMSNGCLEWRGKFKSNLSGHVMPIIVLGRASFLAKAAVWKAFTGERVRNGFTLRNSCKNAICIEPTHLIEVNWRYEQLARRMGHGIAGTDDNQGAMHKLREAADGEPASPFASDSELDICDEGELPAVRKA